MAACCSGVMRAEPPDIEPPPTGAEPPPLAQAGAAVRTSAAAAIPSFVCIGSLLRIIRPAGADRARREYHRFVPATVTEVPDAESVPRGPGPRGRGPTPGRSKMAAPCLATPQGAAEDS